MSGRGLGGEEGQDSWPERLCWNLERNWEESSLGRRSGTSKNSLGRGKFGKVMRGGMVGKEKPG
jgi:hypothetical protein